MGLFLLVRLNYSISKSNVNTTAGAGNSSGAASPANKCTFDLIIELALLLSCPGCPELISIVPFASIGIDGLLVHGLHCFDKYKEKPMNADFGGNLTPQDIITPEDMEAA
ncbi:MAG TPA: hypothetical protein VM532_00020, partial [Burkholderiales bacterium]|nr:hypothetical protein [Burkholderiales bacterium]